MKRKLLFLAFILISAFANAQYPLLQYLGSDSTMVMSRGGLQGRIAPIPFTDTAAANLSRIRQYPGALIYTSGVDKYWYRNSGATGWIEFTSSGGSTVNIYNSNGNISEDRYVDGGEHRLQFNALQSFQVAADSITFNLVENYLFLTGLVSTQDTSTYKPLVLDPITGRVLQSSYWYGGTGGSSSGIVSLGTSAYGLITQNDSTYKVDTTLLSTKLWRQKGIDSVQSNVNLKLNITDTANMRVRLYEGSNITITGTYPNLTVASTGGGADTSVLLVDTLYNRIATTINADSLRLKSLRIRNGTTTITPTVTDSTLSFDVTGTTYKIGTYNSQTINGDGASIVADSIYMQEFSAESPGLVPPGGSGSTYLRGDGTWQTVSGSTTGVKSIEIVGDSAYLVNDSNTLTGTKVYGYYNGTKGWKESKKMTFVIPYDGEVVMISGDSLTNGRKVDSIYRTVGKDSIIFLIAGTRYAVKDSTGGGGVPGGSTTQVQYNNAGSFAGSSNMTFDGTMLTLPGSSSQSAIKAGTIELQSLAVNNAWFGENVYYSAGWKARATGYTPMFYFPTGQIRLQTVAAAVTAGNATTPLTRIKVQADGKVAIGANVDALTATAALHLTNGSNTVAPLAIYLPGADVLSSPSAGAIEAKVDTIYYTGNDAVRTQLARTLYKSATLDFGSTSAQTSADLTITVTGAADGDIVSIGVPNGSADANSCYTGWVSAANTVTVRFNNYSSGAIDPASGTFKVRVFK